MFINILGKIILMKIEAAFCLEVEQYIGGLCISGEGKTRGNVTEVENDYERKWGSPRYTFPFQHDFTKILSSYTFYVGGLCGG